METLTTIAAMRAACRAVRTTPQIRLGLVPTMGALHEGHRSLVRAARASCDRVAASLFVNPTQFGPNEDLARYPRTFEADQRMLAGEGVDLLFAPPPEEMYPAEGKGTFVEVPALSDRLDGASRPGHFRGVATIVAKLFHIVGPDRAFFGQKDGAQVAVIEAMVRDLDFGVEVVVCPTVREPDGLALSSRNRYLSASEREQALALSRALRGAEDAVRAGERDAAVLKLRMQRDLAQTPAIRLDYLDIVDRHTLRPQALVEESSLLAVAGWVGDTRLIDNLPLTGILPEMQ